mmetsp:Transcript_27345/g.27577  ORF Transcript_27345/g.27577 Transcript_27345/m.27577 type:complete len:210 (-) Transcript_27345:240-869(-)
MESLQATSNVINLKGSTEIVTEFFDYSVNSILYQRGIYPPESFKRISKYGLAMMQSTDEQLRAYVIKIMKQMEVWLMKGNVQKLVLVIKGLETGNTLERWMFNCESTGVRNAQDSSQIRSDKSQKEITQEIQAIIRQITASVTFLPLLNEPCSFDLLVYADTDAEVPMTWEDSDPCNIENSEEVKLRSFNTKIHKVDAMVAYRLDADEI